MLSVLASRVCKALLCAGLAAMLANCDSVGVAPEDYSSLKAQPVRVQPGDKLKITVYGEDKLSGDYVVDPGGSLSIPLTGTMQAAGLTKAELERVIMKKLASQKYLVDPKVTVDIAEFRPFYVLGEVEKPGEYAYKSGLNVSRAIAIAGGATYRASEGKILIQRDGESNFTEVVATPSIPVFPGDVVKIPERYF